MARVCRSSETIGLHFLLQCKASHCARVVADVLPLLMVGNKTLVLLLRDKFQLEELSLSPLNRQLAVVRPFCP